MAGKEGGRLTLNKALLYARFAAAGGIAGLAVYNTAMSIISASPVQSYESIAIVSGSVLLASLAKLLHVV